MVKHINTRKELVVQTNRREKVKLMQIAEIVSKKPMELTKEDIIFLQTKVYDKSQSVHANAEQVAEAYWALKKKHPDIFVESIKVDIALATNGKMPPKKWLTEPYFPRR